MAEEEFSVRPNISQYIFNDGHGNRLSPIPLTEDTVTVSSDGTFIFREDVRVFNLDQLLDAAGFDENITCREMGLLCESVLRRFESGEIKL